MNEEHRTALRVANLIRDQVAAQEARRFATLASEDRSVNGSMTRYLNLCRSVAKAHSRKWLAAARNLSAQATTALEYLHYEIESRRRQRHDESQPISSLGDIVRDLQQIEDEFHGWEFDDETGTLSVETDSIELEGVYLGPFEIQLRLRDLSRSDLLSTFDIIAKEPNGAGGRDTVTHPHVSEQRLCAGDAMVPIQGALQTGRICDFFILVRSVLQTYNPQSAYVRLEEWNGEPCHDCGYLMDDDSGFYCEFCEHNFCESCTSYCSQCETAACMGCMETCPECSERACPNCMKTCQECGHTCCEGCLTDGLCPSCHEEQENQHDSDESDGSAAAPVAASEQAA